MSCKSFAVFWIGTAMALSACSDIGPGALPLDVSVQATPATTTTGVLIDFVVTAQGSGLVAVTIDYADGDSQVFDAGGSRTAKITFPHAYQAAGTFIVLVKVVNAAGAEKVATVTVTIN